MEINGKTRLLGLIGNPVEHTRSPLIHNTIAEGLNGEALANTVYVPFYVEQGKLEDAIRGAFALNVLGMNVTVPYKTDVIPFLQDIDEKAAQIGAVNTLVRTRQGYKGYNTDATGIGRELDYYHISCENRTVVMLGAGGAARAVAFELMSRNPKKIWLLNRTLEKAQELSDSVNKVAGKELMVPALLEQTGEIKEDNLIVIQCTSVGLSPNDEACVIPDGPLFDQIEAAVDLVYQPAETRFMQYVRQHGGRAYNGLRMLLYQGITAYELFTGEVVEERLIQRVYHKLSDSGNLVLTGFMGSGKTSISSCLSKLLHRELLDTDQYIEAKEGMSISSIFETRGEEAFRKMETQILTELTSTMKNTILSTGGGLPLRRENAELLTQTGVVVYLRVKPETIVKRLKNDTSRPLLQGNNPEDRIRKLLMERKEKYEKGADLVIDVDQKTVMQIAEEIINKLGLSK